MTTVRQDAWTKDEDLLLAEVVLRHIREGSTQLKAFEEVGKKLSRTPAACGFRWNSQVRKQYKTGIELSKKQRKDLKKKNQTEEEKILFTDAEVEVPDLSNSEEKSLSFESVINYLQDYNEKQQKLRQSAEQLKEFKEKLFVLELEVQELKRENQMLKKENKAIKDDYLALLTIMEKARKLAVKEEENQVKMKFQMDPNGNLEALKK
ncbi:RsfA family transcriptional regulator [Caldibacillus lycopersici]|uniref:RsfA family transcriptional regulator n=1 Tax=Perspicuibacillus lycopersici TaxID=1325689 RepID=A0AAE3IR84_9BACI|nr:RsfA family transcriptional regulator [Perspicuibacillus lycopersici]MCU9612213.1 RsfA family transcriptional regulator [Perspicuibacillus lycopersici]